MIGRHWQARQARPFRSANSSGAASCEWLRHAGGRPATFDNDTLELTYPRSGRVQGGESA